ncbi:hypothetical protein B566_EDAN002006 [Ephemera danica]|nr:hypothetical protein B566_EDAN002006 [Ephemera danica]
MQVVEPKVDNSGCYQGTFIHRHRIPLPWYWKQQHSRATNINAMAAQASGYYSLAYLNVGKTLELYGRQFSLVSCDRFTRLMLQRLGAFVPEDQEIYEEDTHANNVPPKPLLVRFTGYWDDRKSPGGQLHHLLVLYFLADDTPLVLNVMQGKFLMDSSPAEGARQPCDWVKDVDLSIGATISVFGRLVVLTSCDAFTQKYYRSKYGIEEFPSIASPYDEDSGDSRKAPVMSLPPYNGFGTFEDSAANCKSIIPSAPKRNFVKFLLKDRQGMESHVLRFSARLCDRGSDPRQFVISFYLRYAGGKFLERSRLLKPKQDIYKVVVPAYYGPEDFYVGTEIQANDFVFHLTGADEYALAYMEKHCNEFPNSNAMLVLNKVREVLKDSYKDVVARILEFDRENSGTISSFQSKVHDELRRMLFKDVDLLRVELRNRDPNHTNYISRTDAWAVCRSLPVPISPETLSLVLDRVKSNQNRDINHEDLLYFLDIEGRRQQQVCLDRINYSHLIKELQLEQELIEQTS